MYGLVFGEALRRRLERGGLQLPKLARSVSTECLSVARTVIWLESREVLKCKNFDDCFLDFNEAPFIDQPGQFIMEGSTHYEELRQLGTLTCISRAFKWGGLL